MIQEVNFNREQEESLASRIEDCYTEDGIETAGLEVTHVDKLDHGYRVYYTYERVDCTIAQNRVDCTFGFDGDTNRVVDFKEIS